LNIFSDFFISNGKNVLKFVSDLFMSIVIFLFEGMPIKSTNHCERGVVHQTLKQRRFVGQWPLDSADKLI